MSEKDYDQDAYDDGWFAGNIEGYDEGYDNGYKEGFAKAKEEEAQLKAVKSPKGATKKRRRKS